MNRFHTALADRLAGRPTTFWNRLLSNQEDRFCLLDRQYRHAAVVLTRNEGVKDSAICASPPNQVGTGREAR